MAQRPDFQCDVASIAYDFDSGVGTLNMAPNNCCDMSGCLAFFENIDKNVERIETFAGSRPDTIYVRSGSDWMALDPA